MSRMALRRGALPTGELRLGELYRIGRLLTCFTSVDETVPAVLSRLSVAVPVCTVVVARSSGGRTRVLTWHCPRLPPQAVAAAQEHALAELAYLVPAAGAPETELIALPALSGPAAQGVEEFRGQFVVLPLAVEGSTIFGLAQMQSVLPLDQAGLAFINAVVNQLSVAMAGHETRAREAALRATLERRVAERTAELEEKVRELNTFSYSVAHDLRAPVRSMGAFCELLLRDSGERLDERGRDHARRVVRASRRMEALIHDLLSYSRLALAELPLEPVALGELVERVLAGMAKEVSERGARVEVAPDLPVVRAHRDTLAQALHNLLSNAVKFTAPGKPASVRVSCERGQGRARLWVADDGIGVAPEHHGRIFGVFHRLHPPDAYSGTGIGLAIVRKAMERMGGGCGLESAPGRGSRFWLELPM